MELLRYLCGCLILSLFCQEIILHNGALLPDKNWQPFGCQSFIWNMGINMICFDFKKKCWEQILCSVCSCARETVCENNGEKDAWNPENKSRSQHKNVRGFLFLNVFWNFIRATSLEIFKIAELATLLCRIALYEPFFFVNKQINTCLTQKWFTDLPRVQMPCAKPFLLGASWPCLSLASREHSRTCCHMLKRSKKLLQAITSTLYTSYKEEKFTSLQRGALGYGSWSFISFGW